MNHSKHGGSAALGIFLLVVAVFFLVFAAGIAHPMSAGQGGIGPRTFPIVLALLLGSGGVVELTRSIIARRRDAGSQSIQLPDTGAAQSTISDHPGMRLLTTLGLIVAYVAAVPLLGFSLSSAAFATLLSMRLGMRWHIALVAALVTTVAIKLLFTGLFRVQLPEGVFGLPW